MRRVVITGIGAVSPCGLDTETTWSAIKAGKSGIARIALFASITLPALSATSFTTRRR